MKTFIYALRLATSIASLILTILNFTKVLSPRWPGQASLAAYFGLTAVSDFLFGEEQPENDEPGPDPDPEA